MASIYKKQVSAVIGAKFAALTEMTINAYLTLKGNESYYRGEVVYAEGADTIFATMCRSNGAEKTFKDLDSLTKEIAKAAPGVDKIVLNTNVGEYTPQKLSLTATPQSIKDANNRKWNAAVLRQDGVLATLDASLVARASWATGNSLQQAAHAELTAQRAIANEYRTFALAQIIA